MSFRDQANYASAVFDRLRVPQAIRDEVFGRCAARPAPSSPQEPTSWRAARPGFCALWDCRFLQLWGAFDLVAWSIAAPDSLKPYTAGQLVDLMDIFRRIGAAGTSRHALWSMISHDPRSSGDVRFEIYQVHVIGAPLRPDFVRALDCRIPALVANSAEHVWHREVDPDNGVSYNLPCTHEGDAESFTTIWTYARADRAANVIDQPC